MKSYLREKRKPPVQSPSFLTPFLFPHDIWTIKNLQDIILMFWKIIIVKLLQKCIFLFFYIFFLYCNFHFYWNKQSGYCFIDFESGLEKLFNVIITHTKSLNALSKISWTIKKVSQPSEWYKQYFKDLQMTKFSLFLISILNELR